MTISDIDRKLIQELTLALTENRFNTIIDIVRTLKTDENKMEYLKQLSETDERSESYLLFLSLRITGNLKGDW